MIYFVVFIRLGSPRTRVVVLVDSDRDAVPACQIIAGDPIAIGGGVSHVHKSVENGRDVLRRRRAE